jgi:hypothetical protein
MNDSVPKYSPFMKKAAPLVWLAIALIWCCGCREYTDSISNQTAHTVRLNVAFVGGMTNYQMTLPGTNSGLPGIVFQRPVRIKSLEAFDWDGRKIGEFSRHDLPRWSNEYGRYNCYAIFDDGVFPVAKSCVEPGSYHLSEEHVKSVLGKASE